MPLVQQMASGRSAMTLILPVTSGESVVLDRLGSVRAAPRAGPTVLRLGVIRDDTSSLRRSGPPAYRRSRCRPAGFVRSALTTTSTPKHVTTMTMNPSKLSPAEVLTALNAAWVAGRLADLERLLHPRSVIVGSDLTRLAEGRAACVASYRDFLAAVTVHAFEERDIRAEEYDGTAVVSYSYRINYESGGEQYVDDGREVLVLVRAEYGWQAVWRQVLVAP
jgi:hypothetical protein